MGKKKQSRPDKAMAIEIRGPEDAGKTMLAALIGKKLMGMNLGYSVYIEDEEIMIAGDEGLVKFSQYGAPKKPAWDETVRRIAIKTFSTEPAS